MRNTSSHSQISASQTERLASKRIRGGSNHDIASGRSLKLNNVSVYANQLIDAANIDAASLSSRRQQRDRRSLHFFTFQVQDDGGTADGSLDTDVTPRTMTLNVMPSGFVNHAPVGATTHSKQAKIFRIPLSGDFGFDDLMTRRNHFLVS